MGSPRKPKAEYSKNWGGGRPAAGRWRKDEIAAIKSGEPDVFVAAIKGRPLNQVAAKRAKMNGIKPGMALVPAQPKSNPAPGFDVELARRIVAESRAAALAKNRGPESNPFRIPTFPPKSMPPKKFQMAMDENLSWAGDQWATANGYPTSGYLGSEGLQFFGYPYLAELTQRPEYRVISETIADDATRKWIDFEVTGEEKEKKEPGFNDADPDERKAKLAATGKTDKVKALKDEMERLDVRDRFYTIAVQDGFFGRSHLYIDCGVDLDDRTSDELMTPIGNGRDAISKRKIEKGSLKGLKTVEAVWAYPTTYNAINPLKDDWYNPEIWWVNGIQVHQSRLQNFVGHPVPDLLKPAYSFGGLSLSQMAKPYVDIWLKTRESVGALIHSFSVMVLMTDVNTILQPNNAGGLIARAAMFNALRDNQGLMMINKATEDFKNVSASMAGLHELQGQAQEHMASIVRIPLVKFTGSSPSGLNACLPGDTLILTDRGQVLIRDVTLSDLVMTRRGLAPLVFSGITKYATELIEISTETATLKCTANHPIWLPSINAFVPAENVRQGDLLLLTGEKPATPNMRRPWHGVGDGGGRTQAGIILRGMLSPNNLCCSIGEFGKHIAGLFRRVFISTTSTTIRETIRLLTLNRCMEFSTPSFTASNLAFGDLPSLNPGFARSAERSSLSQNSRAERSFAAMPARSPTGEQTAYRRQEDHRSAFVSCVAQLSARLVRMLSFVRASVQPRARIAPDTIGPTISRTLKNLLGINEMPDALRFAILQKNASDAVLGSYRPDAAPSYIARNDAKISQNIDDLENVVSVRRIWASEPVYDLTVAPGYLPEFFANRILTHNSSEGEVRSYYDTIASYQNRFFRPHLTTIINFMQLSLWGEIDPEITFEFEPLWEMSAKEKSDLQKSDADRDQIYVDMGVFAPAEIRKIKIDDPELPYTGFDPEDLPDLREEEEAGLQPEGGRPDPLAAAGPGVGATGKAPDVGKGGEAGGNDANLIPFAQDAEWREDLHPRGQPDNAGQFGPGGGRSPPGRPGTAKIPAGRLRRFHVTDPRNEESIRSGGLKYANAKGVEGPKAIYSWDNPRDAQSYAGQHGSIVEFHDDPKHYESNPTGTTTNVPPENIVAIHQPWHEQYHYAKENDLSPAEVRAAGYEKAAAALEAESKHEVTETPAFKKWFGGSKVVDKVGKPLVVYHGDRQNKTAFTGREDKSNYIQGNIFFSDDPAIAKGYTPHRTNSYIAAKDMNETHGLYRAYLSLQKPLVIDAKDADWSAIPVPRRLGTNAKQLQIDDLAVLAKKNGYDGLIVRNVFDQFGHGTQYAVFEPTQIKSATGNKGTFDPKSPNIGDASLASDEFVESQHPRVPSGPEGGEFAKGSGGGSGGGGAAVAPTEAEIDAQMHPKAIAVGGDEWNKKTAIRLEREYVKSRPALEKIVNEAVAKHATGEAAGEELPSPEEWDGLTSSTQDEAKEAYTKENYQSNYDSEEQNWHENGDALDDAKSQVAYDFNKNNGHDHDAWAVDAMLDYLEQRHEDELPRIPYTQQQLLDALTINYENGHSGSNDGLTIEFNDKKLQEPDTLIKGQLTLPGIEESEPSDALTKEMREDIIKNITLKFDERAEKIEDDMEPPDYLQESANESADSSWEEMDDDEKYEWAKKNTDLIAEAEAESPGTEEIAALPNKFDPLEQNASHQDYRRTQRLARYLSEERASQLLVERGIIKDPAEAKRWAKAADTALWDGWKSSSTSNMGKVLQVATAEELGGKYRNVYPKRVLSAEQIARSDADGMFPHLGGYDGVKAYIRAKWETSQYLLDKADMHVVDVYRAVNIPEESRGPINISELTDIASAQHDGAKYKVPDFDKGEPGAFIYFKDHDAAKSFVMEKLENGPKRVQVEGGYTKLPDLPMERNGAASTTTDIKIANNWDGSSGRVVIRASVPRTAVLSIPAYGQNVHSEHEVVIAGTSFVDWDAWAKKAPTFSDVPIAEVA